MLGVSYFIGEEKLAAPSAVATTMCAHGSGDREMLILGKGEVEDPTKSSPNSPNAYQSIRKVVHFPLLYPHMIFSFVLYIQFFDFEIVRLRERLLIRHPFLKLWLGRPTQTTLEFSKPTLEFSNTIENLHAIP